MIRLEKIYRNDSLLSDPGIRGRQMKPDSGEFREKRKQKKSHFPSVSSEEGSSLSQGYQAHSWEKHDFGVTEDKDAPLGSNEH